MSELTSKFSRDDIETLIEATGDWEVLGNQEWQVSQMVKSMPMPPEDHEAYEMMEHVKDHFRQRERSLSQNRAVRQEKSVFLKAKLMLIRRDMQVSDLFEMATDPNTPSPQPAVSEPSSESTSRLQKLQRQNQELKEKLETAEFFIKDLGVEQHYQKFIADRRADGQQSVEPQPESPS